MWYKRRTKYSSPSCRHLAVNWRLLDFENPCAAIAVRYNSQAACSSVSATRLYLRIAFERVIWRFCVHFLHFACSILKHRWCRPIDMKSTSISGYREMERKIWLISRVVLVQANTYFNTISLTSTVHHARILHHCGWRLRVLYRYAAASVVNEQK